MYVSNKKIQFKVFFLSQSCNIYFRFSLVFLFVCLFLFCRIGSLWEFLGQGLNLHCTAATRATLVRMQEAQPAGPSESSYTIKSFEPCFHKSIWMFRHGEAASRLRKPPLLSLPPLSMSFTQRPLFCTWKIHT